MQIYWLTIKIIFIFWWLWCEIEWMFLCDNAVIYYSWFDYSLTDAYLLQALQKWTKRRKIFAYRSTRIFISWQNIRKTWKEFCLSIKVHFYVWRIFRKWIFMSIHTKNYTYVWLISKSIFSLTKILQHFKLDLVRCDTIGIYHCYKWPLIIL